MCNFLKFAIILKIYNQSYFKGRYKVDEMKKIKTKTVRIKTKQTGVYYQLLTNGDRSYFVTYKSEDGKKVWKKIGNYSEGIRENYCKKIRDEIVVKLRNGEEVVKKYQSISFKDIISKYYSTRISNEKNIKKEMSVVNLHLIPYYEQYSINKIEEKDIINFKKSKSHYSPKTINNMLTILNALFAYAYANELINAYATLFRTPSHFLFGHSVGVDSDS